MRVVVLFFGLVTLGFAAGPLKFSSTGNRTHLLELYSSEGCSSCPPAEKWLGELRDDPGLWRDFVPVAFHVNYWDQLGWRDRFASKEYTARQYAYSSQWGSDTVYTPGFVMDGAEWRKAAKPPAAATEKAGRLAVEYSDNGQCRVTFTGGGDAEVHVALLGGGVISNVRAGENSGRVLRHEFIVLTLKAAPLKAGVAELSLSAAPVEGVTRRALAVWVTPRGGLTPLQATGGWIE